MSNPAPRPALRTAADAEVHPAAPRPARSPRATRPPVPAIELPPAPAAATGGHARAKPRKPAAAPRKRKFSGATSDHLRVPEVPAEVAEVASGSRDRSQHKERRPVLDTFFPSAPEPEPVLVAVPVTAGADQPAKGPRTAKAAKEGKRPARAADLLSGKEVDLDVQVPKAMRKAARAEAAAQGLDLDTVVIDLLHAWLTDQG
jgi:hypothetical protein